MTDQKRSPHVRFERSSADLISPGRRVGPKIAHQCPQLDKQCAKQFNGENNDITFRESDAHLVHHPHCDFLIFTAMMANNNVDRILVDNGSSVDILHYQGFQEMG